MTTNRDTSPSAIGRPGHRRAAAAGPRRPAVVASPHLAALLELLNGSPAKTGSASWRRPGSPREAVERTVPLTPALAAALREHLAARRRLALSDGRPPSPLDTCWPDRPRRNGFTLTHRTPHELSQRPARTPDRGKRGRTTSAAGVSST